MAWSARLVIAAVLHVALRAWTGLAAAPIPWPVKLHVALAFANMPGASVFGIVVGLNRIFGWFAWSPMSAVMKNFVMFGVLAESPQPWSTTRMGHGAQAKRGANGASVAARRSAKRAGWTDDRQTPS
jgi:hypothetical protein